MAEFDFAKRMRQETEIPLRERIGIVYRLSLPGILAQISEIIMQYIDAAMVGSLGAAATASIGIVASSTWLFGGLSGACASGFSVQAAHSVGAGDLHKTRSVFRQALVVSLLFSLVTASLGLLYGSVLPEWLGAAEEVRADAHRYFFWFCVFIPVRQVAVLLMNMVQSTGNMKVPSLLYTLECILDVIFNALLIFPSREVRLMGMTLRLKGAGLGVAGAQLGTSLAILTVMVIGLFYTFFISPAFAGKGPAEEWKPRRIVVREAVRIGVPMAMESSALCAAQVFSTKIVAPLGTTAIAAHSFAITAESICYMPGFGISSAATTMVGQAVGAKRRDLALSFAWLTTFSGMLVMTLAGGLMYFLCPYVFAFLTPVEEVRLLGAEVLRIELLAEPLFAASIVAAGALRGAGDTLVPEIGRAHV